MLRDCGDSWLSSFIFLQFVVEPHLFFITVFEKSVYTFSGCPKISLFVIF